MSTTPRAVNTPYHQLEPPRSLRFVRVCREHGGLLRQDARGRLRCPRGHNITPFRGGWTVVDLRSGRAVAAATTEAIEVTDSLLRDALSLFRQHHDLSSPARTKRLQI
jgi:hypothetical protein